MHETLYRTVDAVVSPLDSGCRCPSIRQRMQVSFYQKADAGVSLSDSEYNEYLCQTEDEGDTLSDS